MNGSAVVKRGGTVAKGSAVTATALLFSGQW
jgi:hypothetical protein